MLRDVSQSQEPETSLTGDQFLDLFISQDLGDEWAKISLTTADDEPVDVADGIPSWVMRAAIVTYYIELTMVAGILNGPGGMFPVEA